MVDRVLSLRIAVGKVLLTLLGLASGASIGREGPTVQVGASIMHALGDLLRLPRLELRRALVLAGGAAGIAAAFNTPLAGIVFAIEELSHSFEARTSGTVFTAVVVAGATTLGLVGNYTYFGQTSDVLSNGRGLAGGNCVQRDRWAGRRIVQPDADHRGKWAAGTGWPAYCPVSRGVCGAVRAAAGDHRHAVGRPDIRDRVCPGTRHGRGPFRSAGGLWAAETGGDGGVLRQRHSRGAFSHLRCPSEPRLVPCWHLWFTGHRLGR